MKFQSICLAAILPSLLLAAAAWSGEYDPLERDAAFVAVTPHLTVRDEARNRDIPIRVYLPTGTNAAPVILFSHGLGGSRDNNPYLGNHWAARGYVVVCLQHAGSDETVWKTVSPQLRKTALIAAANVKNLRLRIGDVSAVLTQLKRWNAEAGHGLAGRLNLERVGMSGHSFGASTTQAVSGQVFPPGLPQATDLRIRAALALSPSAPKLGSLEKAFGSVRIPWMLMTGTKDAISWLGATVESRLAVFPALPPGDKYELVLDGAEHSAFGDRPLPGDREKRNPNHHRAILALSTAFWDATLKDDPDAKAWLDGDGPRSVLEPDDHWQRK